MASCRACSPRLIVLLISLSGAFISVSSWRLVARLEGRGGFGFSSYPGDGEWSEVLVSSSRGLAFVCLRCRRGMWRCRSRHRCSRLLPIILWLRGMGSVRCLSFGSSSSASYSRGYCSHLVSLVRLETTGREAGRRDACLDIGVRLIMPRRLIYIMNMMYAMYIKDTRIQGYEDMMDI